MWKLTIEDEQGATREVELVRDAVLIGRDASCDLCLPERNVSRRQARLERDADGCWWLVDLRATYGSFVNGLRVEGRAVLAPGDVLQVGDHWLGLVGDEATLVDERPPAPWGVRSEPDQLLVFEGPDNGAEVRLDTGPVLVGVGEGVTIQLPEGVAPEGVHALIRPLPQGRYEIVRRSAALSMLVRLKPAERALLDDGDLVCFEQPGRGEVMALRFCAARRVRHSTLTPASEFGVRAGLERGRLIDPATLPTIETLRAALAARPGAWRAWGEDRWPRPEGYRPPAVRFGDVNVSPPRTAPMPTPDGPRRQPTSQTSRWAAAAALLALLGVTWGLTRTFGGERPPVVGTNVVARAQEATLDVRDQSAPSEGADGAPSAAVPSSSPAPASDVAAAAPSTALAPPRLGAPAARSPSALVRPPGGSSTPVCRALRSRMTAGVVTSSERQLYDAQCR
jgi:hypothetical protein